MRIFIIVIANFILLVFFYACNTSWLEHAQHLYKKNLASYPKQFVKHFPSELPKSYLGGYHNQLTILADSCFGANSFLIYTQSGTDKYNDIKRKYESLSLQQLNAVDTNIILVFSYCNTLIIEGEVYRNQETQKNMKLASHNLLSDRELPVPLFEIDEYKGNTMCGLTEDFKLYVLDAQPGKYLADEYLQECECLPEKWKHGFSRGIAASDKRKVMIYWITVW